MTSPVPGMRVTPDSLVAPMADRPGVVWLEGGDHEPTIVAWDPVEVVTDAADWPGTVRRLARGGGHDGPFDRGVLGYVGYGAGQVVERVPGESPTAEPPVWLARYEGAAICSPEGRWSLVGSPSFRADAARRLERAQPIAAVTASPTARLAVEADPAGHEAAIRRILGWIAAGDCYQVNLTRAVHLRGGGDPFSAYRRLRALARAAYGAWIRVSPDIAILSSSPELLLDADGGGEVRSLPIKGTRPRHADPVIDRALAHELKTSAKDLAELTMIVDLVRNDLGRIAAPGGVRWGARRITAHANVHHAAQEVVARLAADQDAVAALAALFPPGSVTGAPKVRACERISEVEPEPRGVYCGTIGRQSGEIGRWNVAIRTAVWSSAGGGTLRYHVGGGIVADSDPAAEWAETVHKGTVMARAFAGAPSPEGWGERASGGGDSSDAMISLVRT